MADIEYIDELSSKQIRGFTSTANLRTFGVKPDDFWKYAVKSDQCWNWAGPSYPNSYGYIKNEKGATVAAHRYAYFLAYDFDPSELYVCHHCDNKSCVRPDHLFLGTHLSNMHDMTRKRQQVSGSLPLPQDLLVISNMLSNSAS